MITRDRHHPSVFAWSVTNECANTEPGVIDATETLIDRAHDLDDSRPVTLATNTALDWDTGEHKEDDCLPLCDFVCVNYYAGWYGDDPSYWDEYVEKITDAYPDQAIVFSEFGGGAIEGERTFEKAKWSEPYQAELLESALDPMLTADDVAGFTIWQ
jgi:beta-glucuronidase